MDQQKQEQVLAKVTDAETRLQFLWHDGQAYSPREMRRVIANGWTVGNLMEVDPVEIAADYSREAEEHREEAKHVASEAARIRRELKALQKKLVGKG